MLNNLTKPHEYPGKLFVVEGIDGSGKTTQLGLLAKWLSAVFSSARRELASESEAARPISVSGARPLPQPKAQQERVSARSGRSSMISTMGRLRREHMSET